MLDDLAPPRHSDEWPSRQAYPVEGPRPPWQNPCCFYHDDMYTLLGGRDEPGTASEYPVETKVPSTSSESWHQLRGRSGTGRFDRFEAHAWLHPAMFRAVLLSLCPPTCCFQTYLIKRASLPDLESSVALFRSFLPSLPAFVCYFEHQDSL